MKVLIVTNVFPSQKHPYHGIFVSEQVSAIKALHPDVDFDIHYINGFKGKIEYLKSIWEVNWCINNGNYDIVHIHYGFSGLYLYWPFVKNVPTLVTFHGSDIQPAGGGGIIPIMVSRYVAKKAVASIVLNDKMESMVKPYCSNTYIVPCAVDVRTFHPMNRSEVYEKVQIVFPSCHERKVKNYPLFCEVMRILKNKYDIEVEDRELKNLNRVQIAQLYANSDLLLMTSNSEGSPQAVKEALACNLPCVSTPVGDVKTLLYGVADCYVSTSHNAEELADLAFKSLQKNGRGVSGVEQVKKLELDAMSVANKIYNIYNTLL